MVQALHEFSSPFALTLQKVSGIYCLVNTTSGKFYIGSTTNFYKRFYRHRAELRVGCHANGHLQRSFTKNNENDFIFVVLETCPRRVLLEREEGFVKQFVDDPNCYNIVRSALRCPGHTFSLATIEKMRLGQLKIWNDPERRARYSAERMGRKLTAKHIAATSGAHCLPYDVTGPDGTRHVGTNRAAFCEKIEVSRSYFHRLLHSQVKACKGWTLTK